MREKFISELLGGSVDQTLNEFRQLAADVRYDGYRRVACRRPSPTASLTRYPERNRPPRLARDLVTVRRVETLSVTWLIAHEAPSPLS